MDEVEQPGDVHQPEKRRRNGQDARRVALGNELTDAQAQHEDDQEAGLKIVRLGRRLSNAQQPRQIKKRARDQQLPAENSPSFEANQTALFNQPVKLRQARVHLDRLGLPGHGLLERLLRRREVPLPQVERPSRQMELRSLAEIGP